MLSTTRTRLVPVLLAALLAPALCAPTALAQHGHSHAVVTQPTSLADCIAHIRDLHARIGRDLAAGIVEPVHTEADALAQYAKLLGRTALKDPTVPRDRVKAVNIAGKELAQAADELHHAADDNDAAKSKTIYASLAPIIARLDPAPAAAQKWTCDMHCEGCKTFDAPGTCPVCKMPYTKLQDVPFAVQVSAAGAVTPGKPTTLNINLLDPSGCPVKDIAVVHDHPLHFMVVSNDLSWYAHEHPVRQKDGAFQLAALAFPAPGKYTVFADFTPAGEPNQVAITALTVPGEAPKSDFKLVEDFDSVRVVDGYEFRVRCNGDKFYAGEDSFFRYGIDKDGKSVTDLQPLMGAMGHLVIIGEDLKTYVHCHPIGDDKDSGHAHTPHAPHGGHDHAGHDHGSIAEKLKSVPMDNGRPSDVIFHAVFPKPGLYRAFAQFQHNGKVLTVPFTINVLKREGAPDAPAAKPAGDHSGHKH